MADPMMIWAWADAPDEFRARIERVDAGMTLIPPTERLAMVFIPEAMLGKLLEEPAFLKPLWRTSRGITRARIDAGMLIAWT